MATAVAMKQVDDVPEGFRVAMSRLAAGVVMVTCHVDREPWGLTVSACCSVSMTPPLILVSLGATTTSAIAIADERRFGVSVLGERLTGVARFGSSRGAPKFVASYCHVGDCASSTPIVASALAHVDCALERQVTAGDHELFIGRVNSVILSDGDRPLVHYSRSFHCLGRSSDLGVGPVTDETIDSLLYDYPVPRRFGRAALPGPESPAGDAGRPHPTDT